VLSLSESFFGTGYLLVGYLKLLSFLSGFHLNEYELILTQYYSKNGSV